MRKVKWHERQKIILSVNDWMGSLGNRQLDCSLRRDIYYTGEEEGSRSTLDMTGGSYDYPPEAAESIWRAEAQERILRRDHLREDNLEPWELMKFERKI